MKRLVDVTFVIPVRNDARRLARCLASIRLQSMGTAARIIVVDNGSTDDSPDVARAAGAEVVVAAGVPVSVIRNRGAAAAPAGGIVAFVDADHELLEGWLPSMLAAMQREGVIGASAAYLGPPVQTPVQRWYAALRGSTSEGPIEWAGAGNLAVRQAAFAAVGGFDESLEACEDVDLCFRLRQAGGLLWGTPGMRSVHHGDPATLRHLFRGELWRGRDNIRVSLRGPWGARSLLSAVLPVVQLLAVFALLVGTAGTLWPSATVGTALRAVRQPAVPLFALSALLMPAAARTLVLWRRERPSGLADAAWAFVVSFTYDFARALALIWRAGHHSTARVRRSQTTRGDQQA